MKTLANQPTLQSIPTLHSAALQVTGFWHLGFTGGLRSQASRLTLMHCQRFISNLNPYYNAQSHTFEDGNPLPPSYALHSTSTSCLSNQKIVINTEFQSTLAECQPRQCHAQVNLLLPLPKWMKWTMNQSTIHLVTKSAKTFWGSRSRSRRYYVSSTDKAPPDFLWDNQLLVHSKQLINDLFDPFSSVRLSNHRHQHIIIQLLSGWLPSEILHQCDAHQVLLLHIMYLNPGAIAIFGSSGVLFVSSLHANHRDNPPSWHIWPPSFSGISSVL